jgi:hypothetical protein
LMFFIGLCVPDLEWFHSLTAVASRRDRSWARVYQSETDGAITVRQGGPRRLWDELVQTCDLWYRLGQPGRERYGMTITADRAQVVWLDSPDSGHSWVL